MPLIRNWCLGLTGQESVHVSWTDFDSLGRCVVKHNGVASLVGGLAPLGRLPNHAGPLDANFVEIQPVINFIDFL